MSAHPRPLSLAIVASTVAPGIHPDDVSLVAALHAQRIESVPCRWNDPGVDWSRFDALLVRTTWDYFQHYAAFLAWLDRIDRLGLPIVNDVALLRWNSDKRYLLEVARRGVDIIPTRVATGATLQAMLRTMAGEVVIKPTVSGGAWHTVRGHIGDSALDAAVEVLPRDIDYLIQPFVPDIVVAGEWSLMFFGGQYSHAVLKRPRTGDYRVQSEYGGSATLAEPGDMILAAARGALAEVAALGHADQAYVRVDGVVTEGRFRLMELEFIEPFLHFAVWPQAAQLFAAQLARRFEHLRVLGRA